MHHPGIQTDEEMYNEPAGITPHRRSERVTDPRHAVTPAMTTFPAVCLHFGYKVRTEQCEATMAGCHHTDDGPREAVCSGLEPVWDAIYKAHGHVQHAAHIRSMNALGYPLAY